MATASDVVLWAPQGNANDIALQALSSAANARFRIYLFAGQATANNVALQSGPAIAPASTGMPNQRAHIGLGLGL